MIGWILFILLFVPLLRAERLPIKTYTVADGLLRDDVQKLMQDSRGFMWFCTFEGVSRFEGYGFTNFRTDDGLPERHVRDILETKSGTIWMATDAGLVRLNPKGIRGSKENPLFTAFLPENPKAKLIQVLFEDVGETLWVDTSDGLFKLNKNSELETANRKLNLAVADDVFDNVLPHFFAVLFEIIRLVLRDSVVFHRQQNI